MHSYLIYLSDDIMVMVKRRLSLEFGTWRFAKGNNARGFHGPANSTRDDIFDLNPKYQFLRT